MSRKSLLLLAAAASLSIQTARARTIYYDPFNYTVQDPSLTDQSNQLGSNFPGDASTVPADGPITNWLDYYGAGQQAYVSSGSLTYPGLLTDTSSGSNSAKFRGSGTLANGTANQNGIDYHFFDQPANGPTPPPYTTFADPAAGQPSYTLYYSMLLSVNEVTDPNFTQNGWNSVNNTGVFFAGFTDAPSYHSGTALNQTAGTLFIESGDGGQFTNTYKLGILGGTDRTYGSTIYSLGTTHLLVVAYTFNAGSSNNVEQLYVDPTPGSLQSDNAVTMTSIPGTMEPNSALTGFFLRNNLIEPDNGMQFDELRVGTTWAEVTPPSAQPGTWNNVAGGSWNLATNWTANTIPSGDGVSATFDSIITSPQTVTVDANTTIGSITFNNANRYTIAGPSTLTLQNSSGSASIHVTSGNHTISAPLSFASNTTVTVDSAVNTLTLNGGISAAGVTTTKAGPGTLAIGGNSNNLGSLAIQQGSVQLLSGMSKAVATSGLSVSSGATLDLTNNAMVVNYSGTSPASSIRSAIISAYNNGAWNQPGITSSTAAANANHTTGVGYAEASDLGLANGGTFKGATIANQAVIIKYTYYGDENLDGVVNLDDFSIFIDGFNGLGSGWIYGDFNYDGKIDQADFSLFVQGFNLNGAPLSQLSDAILSDSSLSASQKNALLSTVPEPASLSLLGVCAIPLLSRRRK